MFAQTSYKQSLFTDLVSETGGSPVSQLKMDYEAVRLLLNLQPAIIQRFIEAQVSQVAQGLFQRQAQLQFTLPDKVLVPFGQGQTVSLAVPEYQRHYSIGNLIERLEKNDMRQLLRQKLVELELASEPGVAEAARLFRYAVAAYLVHQMLPAGRDVTYLTAQGEVIPSVPIDVADLPPAALTAQHDAIVEGNGKNGSAELQTPYVPAARRFFLPQWVIFDEQGHLLTATLNEAQAHLASMQHYLEVLHSSVALAPYMVADPEYQQKRYGMLGQLIHQGREMAAYQTDEIIQKIQQRAERKELNRGLSLSLPYFDDQQLGLRMVEFDVIPAGRIMFVPSFVARASRQEQIKVAQDTRLNMSTRKYLLISLEKLERAFE
jgi:hypothetical protein